MSVVSFKCPACGAPLTFDPNTGAYTCEYCESTYTQDQLDALEQKQVSQEAEDAVTAWEEENLDNSAHCFECWE